jgi:hypothetical protein
MNRFRFFWQHESTDAPKPDPEAVEALRVQRVKRDGAEARRRQAQPIVAAGRKIWERNHLAESLVAAAHRIVESDR